MTGWRAVFRVPVESEEPLAAELWGAGTTGLEIEADPGLEVEITAYFDRRPRLDGLSVRPHRVEAVEDRDWLADYRATARPFPLGAGFEIDPRGVEVRDRDGGRAERKDAAGEEEAAAAEEAAEREPARRLLRIPASTAFGTGTHETTRLMVDMLESVDVAGRSVLDVGTGSGILAFVSLSLGASEVVALDLDPVAALTAARNGRDNALSCRLYAGPVAALAPGRRFDVLLVNVLPDRWLPEATAVAAHLEPGGRALIAGMLLEQRQPVEEALAAAALEPLAERTDGEWLGLVATTRFSDSVISH